MIHAITAAEALGLDSASLKMISESTKNGVSLQNIYQQITELRGKYLSLL